MPRPSKSIYVASSWRNEKQPEAVRSIRAAGFSVYDFRNPCEGDNGFRWTQTEPPRSGRFAGRATARRERPGFNGEALTTWRTWSNGQFLTALEHPRAREAFRHDMNALRSAAAVILLMPCGRSAHLELGFAVGAGIATCIVLDDGAEPELMYKMADLVAPSLDRAIQWLGAIFEPPMGELLAMAQRNGWGAELRPQDCAAIARESAHWLRRGLSHRALGRIQRAAENSRGARLSPDESRALQIEEAAR